MHAAAALLIDFGSTYTKLRAIDLDRRIVLASGQGPSTVTTDISVGMRVALEDLRRRLGRLPRFRYRLGSSSAAGGLRMVTVGLVRELTAEAARRAALGAGAKLVGTYAYRLTAADMASIQGLGPDILLLAGGTDGGNSEVILHNARMLGSGTLDCPIVYAGNRAAWDAAKDLLAGKMAVCAENVMPEFNVLNIEPARAAIREIFLERIVHAKGIDRARDECDAVLMPTPAAVMDGARLLADGHGSASGLGDLVVVDPGGATTDVHSVASGQPRVPGVVQRGLPEPRVKRTVEGDLGMRHNAAAIGEMAGIPALAADARLPEGTVSRLIGDLAQDVDRLPHDAEERALDRALARAALRCAMKRHCGSVETVYTAFGPATAQTGKDLSGVEVVVGTGGVIAHSRAPLELLETVVADPTEPESLRPRDPRFLVDREYLLYACGLLAGAEPEAALELALKYLKPPTEVLADDVAANG
ncbi:MAG: glutamate mutase L [Betaproteobacteria bacterium]|nr:glutamate mutase L [Betaproteobacteria bacterium]MDE2359645.1 glutamate mutase L [Betaproteobacteria bacterium]